MKNKIKNLIKYYEDLIKEEEKFLVVYLGVENDEMISYEKTKLGCYAEFLEKLREL